MAHLCTEKYATEQAAMGYKPNRFKELVLRHWLQHGLKCHFNLSFKN
jgi:hypothetical protein